MPATGAPILQGQSVRAGSGGALVAQVATRANMQVSEAQTRQAVRTGA